MNGSSLIRENASVSVTIMSVNPPAGPEGGKTARILGTFQYKKLLEGIEQVWGPEISLCPKFRDDAREQVSWPGKHGTGVLKHTKFENLTGQTMAAVEPGGH
jgi:hypothetical protein